jgi:hypothetical protein
MGNFFFSRQLGSVLDVAERNLSRFELFLCKLASTDNSNISAIYGAGFSDILLHHYWRHHGNVQDYIHHLLPRCRGCLLFAPEDPNLVESYPTLSLLPRRYSRLSSGLITSRFERRRNIWRSSLVSQDQMNLRLENIEKDRLRRLGALKGCTNECTDVFDTVIDLLEFSK